MSDILKSNTQFYQLWKKLYLKYGCFHAIPSEYQLVLLVSSTAWVCRKKNCSKSELEQYINEPIQIIKNNKQNI